MAIRRFVGRRNCIENIVSHLPMQKHKSRTIGTRAKAHTALNPYRMTIRNDQGKDR